MSETQEILVPRRFFPQLHLLALIVCFTESPEAENSEENKCTSYAVNTSLAYLKKNGFKGQLTLNLREH